MIHKLHILQCPSRKKGNISIIRLFNFLFSSRCPCPFCVYTRSSSAFQSILLQHKRYTLWLCIWHESRCLPLAFQWKMLKMTGTVRWEMFALWKVERWKVLRAFESARLTLDTLTISQWASRIKPKICEKHKAWKILLINYSQKLLAKCWPIWKLVDLVKFLSALCNRITFQ